MGWMKKWHRNSCEVPVRSLLVCGLHPANFQPGTTPKDEILDRDARNFSAWYQHNQLAAHGQAEAFRRAVSEVVDGLAQIRLQKTELNTRELMIGFEDGDRGYELALNEISDDQRAPIALYALVHLSSGLGYTLFLEEPILCCPSRDPALADGTGRKVRRINSASSHAFAPSRVDKFLRRRARSVALS